MKSEQDYWNWIATTTVRYGGNMLSTSERILKLWASSSQLAL